MAVLGVHCYQMEEQGLYYVWFSLCASSSFFLPFTALLQVPGTSAKEVLDMVMLTQYFDTMKDIGAKSKASAIFIPHGPAAVSDIATQIRNGLMQAHGVEATLTAPLVHHAQNE